MPPSSGWIPKATSTDHVVRTEEAGRRRTRKGFGLRRRVPMGDPDLRAVPQVVAVERVNLGSQLSVTCDIEQDASSSWFQFVVSDLGE